VRICGDKNVKTIIYIACLCVSVSLWQRKIGHRDTELTEKRFLEDKI